MLLNLQAAFEMWRREVEHSRMSKLDRLRCWIKYASQVSSWELYLVDRFTTILEREVFCASL